MWKTAFSFAPGKVTFVVKLKVGALIVFIEGHSAEEINSVGFDLQE